MQKNPIDAPWLAAAVVLLALFAAAAFAALNSPAAVMQLLDEGRGVETASASLHFLAAGLALALWWRARGLLGLMAVCAFLMGARELGWHKAFTSHGVFSSKQYFYDTVPLAEKLIAGAIALTLLTLVVVSLIASVRDIRRLIRDRAAAVTGLVTLMVFVPLLMVVDATPRFEENAGLTPSAGHKADLLAIEELGELALPVIVMLVILQVMRAFRPAAGATRQTSASTA